VAFDETFAQVEDVVQRIFPQAQTYEDFGIRGWKVPLENPPVGIKGTIDPNFVYIGLADRKAGPTLHIWHPKSYYWLDEHRDELTAAGFKVMRACLPYTKKRPYPIEVIEKLLRTIEL
jgi:hypothetical protein